MKQKFKILTIIIFVILTYNINASENAISFSDILTEGLENNYNIKLQKLEVDKSNYTLMKANGYLNPYFETGLVYGSGVDPTITNDGTQYFQTNFVLPTNIGIDFYSGVRLESTNLIQEKFNLNSAGAWIGAKIPLLRGLGGNSEINTFINTSKLNQKAKEQQFSNQILTYFKDLLITYLYLSQNKGQYQIKEIEFDESIKYQQDIYELVENDQFPAVEKNRANTLVNQKQNELIEAKISALEVIFNLKKLLGVDTYFDLDSLPILADTIPNPNVKKIKEFISQNSDLETQIKNTPIYKSIALNLKAEELSMDNAENQEYNPLDLDIKVSRFGMYPNGVYKLNDALNSTYPGYSVLLTLSHTFPIGNEQKEGIYLEQQVEYNKLKTNLDQYVFNTTTNVRMNFTILEQKLVLYEQTENIVKLMKQNLLDEKDKFKLGNATQIDIILSFNNYFNAELSLNSLKYEIWGNYVNLKYMLGELPNNKQELTDFSLVNFF